MISLRKYVAYLLAILLVSQSISCQQNESDEGDSLGTPLREQKTQAGEKKTLDAPETATSGTGALVGGAHLWQAPYDTHMVGDAKDMRYGWIYDVNSKGANDGAGYTLEGVPQSLWYKKFDDHVSAFGPKLDEEIAAFNAVDSNMGFQTLDPANLAIPKPFDTTAPKPLLEPEAMPNRDMSHMSIIEQVRQSAPKTSSTSEQKESNDAAKTQAILMATSAGAIDTQKRKEPTLLMPYADGSVATTWSSCGDAVGASQFSNQYYSQSGVQDQSLQQQMPALAQFGGFYDQQPALQQMSFAIQSGGQMKGYEQSVQQQMPSFAQSGGQMQTYERQQVMQQMPSTQSISGIQGYEQQQSFQHGDLTLQQQMPNFAQSSDQIQSSDQRLVQQQPFQQQLTFTQSSDQMDLSYEKQQLVQQKPMMTQTDGQMQQKIYEQQQVMQQMPMLTPSQQATSNFEQMTAENIPFDQQRLMQQQPMQTPIQQTLIADQKESQMSSFGQKQILQQQPMISPTQQFPQTASFDQRFVQQQPQMYTQNQKMLAPGQQFYLFEDSKLQKEPKITISGQQSAILQQSTEDTKPKMYEQQRIQLSQQPTMTAAGLQIQADQQSSYQQNMGFEQRVALPQQQMFAQQFPQQSAVLMTEQGIQNFDQNEATKGTFTLKSNLEAGEAQNQQQMFAPNSQVAFPQQQQMLAFQQQGEALQQQNEAFQQQGGAYQQQNGQMFQQQGKLNLQPEQMFTAQMLPQQYSQLQDGSGAMTAIPSVKPLLGNMDQGKFDEMRAALSESPEVSTLHLLKKLKGGGLGHGVVFAIPAVYGGYAGGYEGATYAKPVYLSPMYAAHEHSAKPVYIAPMYASGGHSSHDSYVRAETPKPIRESISSKANTLDENAQANASGSESSKEIKAVTSKPTSCQTLPTTPSMADEDIMYAAASEMAPVMVGASHGRRGCNCNSVEHDDDDDYDPPVAAVPIEIHPDGSHRINSDLVGAPLWSPQMSKPYLGFWDPRGLLGRLLKPIEELYNQPPPTIGYAYVPVKKTRRPKSAYPGMVSSSSSKYRSQGNSIVGASRSASRLSPQETIHRHPSELNPTFVESPRVRELLLQTQTALPPAQTAPAPQEEASSTTTRSPPTSGSPRKPVTIKAPTVGAVKKQTTRCIQPNRMPPANREQVGVTQSSQPSEQSEKSAAIEGCIRQCLKDV